MKKSTQVNLCIVGMPKAGTTSLHRYLSGHPDIVMSTDKEPHFFSVDLLQEGADFHGFGKYTRYPTLADYLSIFNVHQEKIIGEASVFYLFSKAAAKELYAHNPAMKIIIMLREPVAFLYSLHSQGLYSGNETQSDFATALNLEEHRRQGKHLPSTVHFPSRLFYREHWKVAEQIQRYLDVFPKKQIHIILFDDFKNHTEREFKKVLTFLDVDSQYQPDLANHNPNTRMRSQRLARIIQDPTHPITAFAKRTLPKKLWRRGKVILKKINTNTDPRAPLDDQLQKELQVEAHAQILALENLLHQEGFLESHRSLLKIWKYPTSSM